MQRSKRILFAVLLLGLFGALSVSSASALVLSPLGGVEKPAEFEQPIYVTSAAADPERLFVVERPGRVVEFAAGAKRPYADLTGLVACCLSERGLLSIALAPDFATTGGFYAAYTGTPAAGGAEGDFHLDYFTPNGDAGAVSRSPILSFDHSAEPNHNGGQLQFGPDGRLYVSTGDGGGNGDPNGNGQSLDTLLGKILRIEPRPGQVPAYSAVGNPFAGTTPGRDEIWSYGLRNPWRFSFDRLTGNMVIADVGQKVREEVDVAVAPSAGTVGGAGANYGWNCREGLIAYTAPAPVCSTAGPFVEPVFDYPHDDPGDGGAHGCSITGGYVVRDESLGDLYGRYLYADFCIGEVRSLALPFGGVGAAIDRDEGLALPGRPTSFGEDSCGRLYVTSTDETVYRFVGDTPPACPVAPADAPPQVETGQRPDFRVAVRTRRRGRSGTFAVTVRLLPCRRGPDDSAQLRRGGRGMARKPLDGRCRARFSLRLERKATLRVLVDPAGDASSLRSRRLRLG